MLVRAVRPVAAAAREAPPGIVDLAAPTTSPACLETTRVASRRFRNQLSPTQKYTLFALFLGRERVFAMKTPRL